jgi:hypothetical protein
VKKAFLPIFLITLTSVLAQAQRFQYSEHQEAAIRAGQSTLGPIMVCDLAKIQKDGSTLIVAQTATNPQFGVIPNRPMTLLSDSVTGYVMIQSNHEGEALVQLDIYTNSTSKRTKARIVREGMSINPTPVSEATLKTITAGVEEIYKLSCSMSLNSVSDD